MTDAELMERYIQNTHRFERQCGMPETPRETLIREWRSMQRKWLTDLIEKLLKRK